ncbi:MAG: hypothetical protein A3G75_15705 [Verrucomicrobia bacterium RIFCSPLOWO2_12_FULL_64_8]|nr:MAG: hypothetical protein A3G75_15705 [Verrucomicrobia bacterium RIFCSPLOWO2_12_FULL_64_8]
MKPVSLRCASAERRSGAAAAVIALLLGVSPLRAFVFEFGDVNGSFDSTLSFGVLTRLGDPDPRFYGTSNTFDGVRGYQNSVNTDDGNLNYDKGVASMVLKGTHDLELKRGNFGVFLRGTYFYDFENEGHQRLHTPLTEGALDRVGKRVELLDAYVVGQFHLGDAPLTVRAGSQVISWGESTFIPNGINVINPVDVSRLRVPGAELREALKPVAALHASVAVSPQFTLEGVWLADFRRTEIDPAGSYFSSNDFISRGGSKVMLGFGALPDSGTFGAIPRARDHDANNFNQWGLAARLLVPQLNDTEFGLYYLYYHSRLPVVSARTPTSPVNGLAAAATAGAALAGNTTFTTNLAIALGGAAGVPGAITTLVGAALTNVPAGALPAVLQPFYPTVQAVAGPALQQQFLFAAATGRYYADYPEGISLIGLSFNTDLARTGVSLQGEISLKQDVPLQVDDVELLFAALSALSPTFGANNQLGNYFGQLNVIVPGFRRLDAWQAQMTATKIFGPMLGASQLVVLAEVGATWVPDLPDKSVLRFDGSGTFTSGNPAAMVATGNGAYPATPLSAFADKSSWGYQIVGRLDYNNVFAGINVSPSVAFTHDVRGNTPLPLGNFIDGRKSLNIGAEFTFQNTWSLELRYVDYFGGGRYNLIADRDFASATVKYSF